MALPALQDQLLFAQPSSNAATNFVYSGSIIDCRQNRGPSYEGTVKARLASDQHQATVFTTSPLVGRTPVGSILTD